MGRGCDCFEPERTDRQTIRRITQYFGDDDSRFDADHRLDSRLPSEKTNEEERQKFDGRIEQASRAATGEHEVGNVMATSGFRELYGIEPNRRAADRAKALPGAKVLDGLYAEAEFPGGHFDLISMIHMLDHLIDVNDTLRRARSHLAQGGVIAAVVHDVDSWLSRLLGERFPPFNIQHNHFFSKTTLRRLFLKHGFAVADVRATWNRYSLGYFIENIPAVPAPAKKQMVRWADARAELVWLATWPSTRAPSNLRESLKVR